MRTTLLLLTALTLTGCATPNAAPGNTAAAPPKKTAKPTGAEPKEISLKTADGWTLIGDLYEVKGASKGAVVLLHQRGGSARDWEPLCVALQKAGITVFAIDQRGAGRSTQGPGESGENAPWPTSADIEAAIARLKGKGTLGLAGASYGANNALIYAAAHPEQVKGIALFSPGTGYHGLNALTPARSYQGSLRIYHDKGDSIAGDGPQRILDSSPSPNKTLRLYDGDEHGTALLKPDVIQDAVKFFQNMR